MKHMEPAKRVKTTEWPQWVLDVADGAPLKVRAFPPVQPVALTPAPKPGIIRVLKIYNRFARHVSPEDKKWPECLTPDGFRVNVCKNHRWGNDLSPMTLGPVMSELHPEEIFAYNIEDAWQGSKVWPQHVAGFDPTDREADALWIPTWEEYNRRVRFSRQAKRHRNPNKNDRSNKPLFSIMEDGTQLGYVQARKRTYLKWYEQLVKERPAFIDLLHRHRNGQELLLLEYDGWDRHDPKWSQPITKEMLKEAVDDETQPFGHGKALAACLMNYPVWRL